MSDLVGGYTKKFLVEVTVYQESELPDIDDMLWVLENHNQSYDTINFKVTEV